jgi:hypothetical protein
MKHYLYYVETRYNEFDILVGADNEEEAKRLLLNELEDVEMVTACGEVSEEEAEESGLDEL